MITRRMAISSASACLVSACSSTNAMLEGRFVCPPCGCAMDGHEFDAPGTCPACGMTLVAKQMGPAHEGAAYIADYRENPNIEQREIEYFNGPVRIAATLLQPRGSRPDLAAILIQGSGISSRSNIWAGMMAQLLVINGVAVVFPDKRASGGSSGDLGTTDFNDLSHDALAGVRYVRDDAALGMPADRIGLIGLSEGGRVAPLAAALYPDEVAFVINISGGVEPGLQTLRHERPNTYREQGISGAWLRRFTECDAIVDRLLLGGPVWEEYIACARQFDGGPYAAVAAQLYPTDASDWRFGWLSHFVRFDPEPYWRIVRQPTFVAYGAEDEHDNVAVAASVDILRRAFAESGNVNFLIRVYEGAGHALWARGARTRRFNGAFVSDLSNWIRELR